MKIAIVRRECGVGLGGAEGYCENVARGLSARGHQVYVVSRFSSVVHRNVSWIETRVFGRGSFLKNLSYFFSVRSILKRYGFDLIYGLSRIEGADFLRISDPLHAAWLRLGYGGRRMPAWLRRRQPRHASLLWQERRSISTARYIVTNSDLVKRQVVELYHVRPERIFTVYNGVDLNRFNPAPGAKQASRIRFGIPLEATVVVFVGSDIQRKGLMPLLQAVSRLRNRFGRLHVAAAGFEPSEKIRRFVKEKGMETVIHFLGFRKDTEDVYRAGDVLCLPTSYDPFANVCLEAMACGLPAMTTRTNGACELVARVSPSLVMEGRDAGQVGSVLERWLDMDEGQRTRLSMKCAELSADFGIDAHIDRLTRLFEGRSKAM